MARHRVVVFLFKRDHCQQKTRKWQLHSFLCLCWSVIKEKTDNKSIVSWSLTIPARIRVSLADDAAHFPCIFSPSALSLMSNYIFHASELCHSMGGFMVYSLFGIIQIIVKYFETFYTLFCAIYSASWVSTRKLFFPVSPVLEIELVARVKTFPTKFEINKEFSFHSFNFIGLLYIKSLQ